MLKPCTTETQRHRERQIHQKIKFLGGGTYECFFAKPNWFFLKVFSVSLCLCGEYVFGVKS